MIVGMNTPCSVRVAAAQESVQRKRPPDSNISETCTKPFITTGRRGQAVEQCFQVKARAAHHDGKPSVSPQSLEGRSRQTGVSARCEFFIRRKNIDEMVRNPAPCFHGNFCGPNLQPAVDLDGVAVDDLAARAQRERDAELALARSRRADDRDDRPRRLTLGAHGEGKRRQKRMTSQMTASRASAPTSCMREKRIGRESPRKLFDNISPVGAERL